MASGRTSLALRRLALAALVLAAPALAAASLGYSSTMQAMPAGSRACRCELRSSAALGGDSDLVLRLGELPLIAGGLSGSSRYVPCEEAKLFCPRQCAERARQVLAQDREGSLFPPSGVVAGSLCALIQSADPEVGRPVTSSFWVSYNIVGCRYYNTQHVGDVCCVALEADALDGDEPRVLNIPVPDCQVCSLPPCDG